jgi:predicted ATPase
MIKIIRVEIKNYKSCLTTTLDINDELTALIGANGAGKTNILSAIDVVKRGEPQDFVKNLQDGTIAGTYIKMTFMVDDTPVELISTPLFQTTENPITITNLWKFETLLNDKHLVFPLLLLNTNIEPHDIEIKNRDLFIDIKSDHDILERVLPNMLRVKEFIDSILYFHSFQFSNSGSVPDSFITMKEVTIQDRDIHNFTSIAFLHGLFYAFTDRPDDYQRYLNLIGPLGLNLIDSLKLHSFVFQGDQYKPVEIRNAKGKMGLTIIPKVRIGKNILSLNQLSEGTFRAMALLFFMICSDNPLFIFEEPEIGMHHGLLNSIIEITKNESKNKQIIFSTHSDLVLDKLEPNDLVFITNGSDGTRAQKLSSALNEAEKKALRVYLVNEGSLGQYWKEGGFENE